MTVGAAVAEVFAALAALNLAISHLLEACLAPSPSYRLHLDGARFMYVVKATQPDAAFSVSFTVTDSEGHPIQEPEGLTVSTVSDNPGAVGVIADPGGSDRQGTFHFGSPNADGSPALANVNCTVKLGDGTLIGSFGEQFTVTTGDPAAIASGTITIPDLEPPTPEAVVPS